MSAYINLVVMLGNLCSEVELRYAKNTQEPVASFRIAVGTGDKVCFIPVVVFGKQAENASRFLAKGSACSLEGSMQMQTWKDRDTGKNRTSYSILAHRIQYVGGKSPDDATPQNPSVPPQAPAPGHRYSRADIPESMLPPKSPEQQDPHTDNVDDIPF